MVPAGVEPIHMTYILAMATCVRDLKNPNALGHARELFDLMQQRFDKTSESMSVESVVLYLMLSLSTDSAAKILDTLRHIDPFMDKLKLRSNPKNSHSPMWNPIRDPGPEAKEREKRVVLHLFRTAVGVIDVLFDFEMVPSEEVVSWRAKRAGYSKFASRLEGLINLETRVTEPRSGVLSRKSYGRRDEEEGEDESEINTLVGADSSEPALRAFRRRQKAKVGEEKGHGK